MLEKINVKQRMPVRRYASARANRFVCVLWLFMLLWCCSLQIKWLPVGVVIKNQIVRFTCYHRHHALFTLNWRSIWSCNCFGCSC